MPAPVCGPQVRENFGHGLDRLLDEPNGALHMVVDNPVETVGSGSLGYYIIYQARRGSVKSADLNFVTMRIV